jgi:class 3 adenylate cyclase
VFTDIEGSTRLLKQLGRPRYRTLLADHERLLRETFLRHRGEVVGTEGDSFFVAFRSATDAVAAAVAIQRALAAWTWPDAVDLRVRIGVHSGEAEATAESYLGLSVHRAARIGSAAHGGQMLLSSSTRELVEDDLPEGLCLLDLGQVRLKDLDRPERISQIAGEGLQRDFPPLRGAENIAAPSLRGRSLLLATLAGVIAAAVAIPVFALGGSSKPDNGAPASLSEQVAPPLGRIIARQKIVNASLGSLASTVPSFARLQKAARATDAPGQTGRDV